MFMVVLGAHLPKVVMNHGLKFKGGLHLGPKAWWLLWINLK
jgi:hypothetical protein